MRQQSRGLLFDFVPCLVNRCVTAGVSNAWIFNESFQDKLLSNNLHKRLEFQQDRLGSHLRATCGRAENCKIVIIFQYCTSLPLHTGVERTHPDWLPNNFKSMNVSSGLTASPSEGICGQSCRVKGKIEIHCWIPSSSQMFWVCSMKSVLPFATKHASHHAAYERWLISCKVRSSALGSECKGWTTGNFP